MYFTRFGILSTLFKTESTVTRSSISNPHPVPCDKEYLRFQPYCFLIQCNVNVMGATRQCNNQRNLFPSKIVLTIWYVLYFLVSVLSFHLALSQTQLMFGSFAYFSYDHASKCSYCFTDASLRPIFSVFFFINTHSLLNLISGASSKFELHQKISISTLTTTIINVYRPTEFVTRQPCDCSSGEGRNHFEFGTNQRQINR